MAGSRLVTVTAAGGSGKGTVPVAIAVGEAELLKRPGGVWFVDLTAVLGDNDVPAAIAKAVGLTLHDGDLAQQVVEHLADKDALVILDNCEHVVDGCADFADRFLTAPGQATLLATSREALMSTANRSWCSPHCRRRGPTPRPSACSPIGPSRSTPTSRWTTPTPTHS